MYPRKKEPGLTPLPGESEQLIGDIELLVNNNIGEYLNAQPFRIKLTDFMPELVHVRDTPRLPIGITRLEREFIADKTPGPREFIGMDLLFSYPLTMSQAEENPINIELKWSDNVHAVLALVDSRPIIHISGGKNAEKTLFVGQASNEIMRTYLESIGLPNSFWTDDFKDLLGDIYSGRELKIERNSNHLLDLGTTIGIEYDARFKTNDEGDKEIIQELRLNLDHLNAPESDGSFLTGSTFRNMFRFERNEAEEKWEYRDMQAGKLGSGEFIDQPVQENPKLTIPSIKLLEKAFHFLSQENA